MLLKGKRNGDTESVYFSEGDREEYKEIDTLLFFVGYARSRHTLLASLLDGHPHMIVGNERNLFYRLVHGERMDQEARCSTSYCEAHKVS